MKNITESSSPSHILKESPIKSKSLALIKIEINNQEENSIENILQRKNNEFEIKTRKISKIFISKFLKIMNFLQIRRIINEIIITNLFAFLILVLLIYMQLYVNQYIGCNFENPDIIIIFYALIRELFIVNYYYALYLHYLIFSFFEISSFILQFSISLVSSVLLLLKIYRIDPWSDFLDIYIADVLLVFITAAYYFHKYKTPYEEVKKNILIILFLIVFTLFLHQLIMKVYVIKTIRELTIYMKKGKIIFQIFLFVYFKIYGKILFNGLVFASKNCKTHKSEIMINIIARFYIIDAICSCLPSVIAESLNSIDVWLGIINFLFQLLILYDSDISFLEFAKKIFYKMKRKKFIKNKLSGEEIKVRNVIQSSIKEILIIAIIHSLILCCFRTVFVRLFISKNCKLQIKDDIELNSENILLLLVFLLIFMFALIIKKKNLKKLKWMPQYFSVYGNVYFIILQHFLCDYDLQFYITLYTFQNEGSWYSY